MKNHLRLTTLALASLALLGACQKGDNEKTTADTTTVKGQDTVNGAAMPTTDTVVKTTTTSTDTVQGSANADTSKKADTTKKAEKKKP